jgi:hypothetical protein
VRYLYRKTLGEEPFPIEEALPKPGEKTFADVLQPLRTFLQRLGGSHVLAPRPRLPKASPTPDSDPEAEDDPPNKKLS